MDAVGSHQWEIIFRRNLKRFAGRPDPLEQRFGRETPCIRSDLQRVRRRVSAAAFNAAQIGLKDATLLTKL